MSTMISLQQFYNNTVNQSLLYPPNPESLRGQCFALVSFYIDQVWGTPQIWKPYAYQIITADTNYYTVTINNSADPNQVPPVGAVIVFKSSLPGSGGAGHTSILWNINAGQHTFVSYDSNWGSKTARLVTHDWSYVSGWITPKHAPTVTLASATITTNGDTPEMIETEAQAHQAYKLLRPNGDGSADEITATAGRRTFSEFMNNAQNEVNQRDQNLRDQAAHLTDQQNLINQQNQTITDLSTSGATTKEQYDEALSKIADLNAQLATKHDVLTDLATKLTAAVTVEAPAENVITGGEVEAEPAKVKTPSWTTKLFMWLLTRRTKKD